MNIKSLRKIALVAIATALALSSVSAFAGPDPMSFRPVKPKAAASLKVGSQFAVSCDKCGGVTVSTVDSSRSYLTGFKCQLCKQTFTTISPGGGGRSTPVGVFTYTDGAGHHAFLSAR